MKKNLLFVLLLSLFSTTYAQHVYQFNGNLNEAGAGPALTQVFDATCVPPGAAGGFSSQLITTSACTRGPQSVFAALQNGGLSYPNTTITGTYTISMLFNKSDYSLGLFAFQKIIDFSNGTSDNGLYSNYSGGFPILDNVFSIMSHPIAGTPLVNNQYYLVTLVRSRAVANELEIYLDGTLVLTYADASGDYQLATATTPIIFFRDDVTTSNPCESGPGAIRYISISNAASDATAILAAWNNLCLSVLPVSLNGFTAQKNNDNGILQWQTNNEINTAYFDVERSYDGKTFAAISKVNALQSSTNTYSYTDNAVFASTNSKVFYRLKMVDKNGNYSYSSIVKLSSIKEIKIGVFPNPATNAITISGLNNKDVIRILSIDGKILAQQTVMVQSMILNIEKYKKGSYILQVQNDKEVTQQKFVKL